jgi:pSer/pThr/pTyr-binding forkhead associated (FHA) protein
MSGVYENSKGLKFKYESDASSSFLVIECGSKIIGYQAKMIENNTIQYIVPVETVKAEGTYHLYFNITSKIPLSMYLKRYKLNRVEFLKVILNLSSYINNSAGYLLSASNFVFNSDYIYIEPETMEVRLVYIPAEIEDNAIGKLQTLVSELLMQHIHEEGFGSGNLVQRILSEVRSEVFNIKGFMILINDLLYGDEANVVPTQLPKQNSIGEILENSNIKDKIEEKKEEKENITQNMSLRLIVPGVILQLIMGGIIFICRGVLDSIGKNRTTTYAAVAMIVVAIDILVFRKLQALNLFSAKNVEGAQDSEQVGILRQASGNGLKLVDGEAVKVMTSDAPKHVVGNEVLGDIRPSKQDKSAWDSLREPSKYVERALLREPGNIKSEDTGTSATDAYQRLRKLTHSTVQEEGRKGVYAQCIDYKDTMGQEDITSRCMQKTEILSSRTNKVPILRSKGRLAGERDIVIDRNEIIIGRLQGHVDHVLLNSAVGKLHAELIYRDGECFVKDLNSINGTFVNDIRIGSNKEVALKNNDSLLFANSEFVYIQGQ